ncbi:MAG: YfhO family protein, partial [Deltaproteobacteria bacterium]|nr:YfhO family protein [Deltaproteobacteria bacterium]
ILSEKTESAFEGSCVISHYDYETIRIRTSANKAGYLVLSEIFYPGWEATVDGKEAAIRRGNYIFRVIEVDKGDHEIKLQFVSWPFRLGLTLSLFTLGAGLGFLVWQSRTGKAMKGSTRNEKWLNTPT